MRIMYASCMKKCGSCQQYKTLDNFAKNAARKDGLQHLCKECKKVSQRTYYQNNKKHYRDITNKNRLARMRRNREYVVQYLSAHPCVDCQETDIHVLEFDHVKPGKITGVGRMVSDGLALEKIQAEIDKCEVRCCNCHRRVTFQRRGIDFTNLI